MIAFPNAKINLGLQILRRREDGFHDLESLFYPLPCQDVLEIIPSTRLSFQSSGLKIPHDGKENLCQRAFRVLQEKYSLPNVKIHLHKNIPIGAGLGGGSADAAFTLKLVNQLFSLNLKEEELEDHARTLGSDCAFFIRNYPRLARGKGDEFVDSKLNLNGKQVLIIYPNLHISTPQAYQNVRPRTPEYKLEEVLAQEISNWREALKNDFEDSLCKQFPVLDEIKAHLYQAGAEYAAMTGSGSTIFGIFQTLPSSRLEIEQQYWSWRGAWSS